jgi:hypothetical protein
VQLTRIPRWLSRAGTRVIRDDERATLTDADVTAAGEKRYSGKIGQLKRARTLRVTTFQSMR